MTTPNWLPRLRSPTLFVPLCLAGLLACRGDSTSAEATGERESTTLRSDHARGSRGDGDTDTESDTETSDPKRDIAEDDEDDEDDGDDTDGGVYSDLGGPVASLRVYRSPYREVDWATDRRLRSQFHDHTKTSKWLIDPYDDAGYHVVPLMQYSGLPGTPAAWTELHWPMEDWLTPAYLGTIDSIERFYPNTELGAYWHLTTPFMESYIERWNPVKDPVKLAHHFETTQEAIDLINAGGGWPILAHPWNHARGFLELRGLHAVEVYSAFGWMNFISGVVPNDPNEVLADVWDAMLEIDPQLFAVGVNDWHGPQCTSAKCVAHPEVKDSGKVELVARSSSAEDVEAAFVAGSMFAVKHVGVQPKPDYPHVEKITTTESHITIDADGEVRWISHGLEVGASATLDLSTLPLDTRYVRAEVGHPNGSRVWVQPFVLSLVGDVDGDWDIDPADALACVLVEQGDDVDPDHVAAALAAGCV